MGKQTKKAPATAVVATSIQGIELTVNHSEFDGTPTRSLQMKQTTVETVSLKGSGKEDFGVTNIFNTSTKKFSNERTLVMFSAITKNMADLSDEQIVELAKKNLSSNPKWKLQERRSLTPFVSKAQRYAISQGSTTVEDIASKQLVINPQTGDPALYEAEDGSRHLQYRVVFFGPKSLDTRPQDFQKLQEQQLEFSL